MHSVSAVSGYVCIFLEVVVVAFSDGLSNVGSSAELADEKFGKTPLKVPVDCTTITLLGFLLCKPVRVD